MSSKGRNFKNNLIVEASLRSVLFAALILVLLVVPKTLRAADYLLTPEEVAGVPLKEIDAIHETSPAYSVSPNGTEIPKSEGDDWLPDLSLNAATTAESAKKKTDQTVSGQNQKNKSIYSTPPERVAKRSDSSSVSFADETEKAAPAQMTPTTNLSLSDVSSYEPGFSLSETNQTDTLSATDALNASVPNPPALSDSEFLTETTLPDLDSTLDPTAPLSEIDPAVPPKRDDLQAAELEFPTNVDNPIDHFDPTPLSRPIDLKKEETDPENRVVVDIKCSAGMEMPISRFNNLIKTKIGNPFSQQVLEEDKRRLLQTKQYVDVTVSTTLVPDDPDKVIVNFDFTPLRQIKYIKVIGNRKMSKTEILDELNMKRGETRMDPYDVENGRIRIAELYKSKDLNEPHVEILIGDRPTDVGVVYLIDEGVKQRVRETTFVGNSLVSSARLKSLVSAKPGLLYFIGGEFSRERLDEDVTKLLEYYRNLGCFDAKVDREFETGERFQFFNQENEWVTVKYVIDEGPRYKIRNFLFEGNRVISTDELQSKLKVKPGSAYNHNDLEGDRIALKHAYGERGYVLADIKRTQIFTENDGMIDLRYDIKEDYRYRVKDIKIKYEGEESRTKASVVMNMLDFAPGQVLNDRKIKGSENSLKRSGYFNDKPSEGPLPSVSIIPESENLYFAEESGNGAQSSLRRVERTADATDHDNASDKKSEKDEKTEQKGGEDKKAGARKILGQAPDSKPTFFRSVSYGRKESAMEKGASAFDPGFRVSEGESNDGVGNESGQTESTEINLSDSATLRGQTMEVPTGFGRTRTTQPTQTAQSAWNGSDYVGYQGASSASNGVNSYSDTSMYNNGSSASNSTVSGLNAANAAPPMTASAPSSGVYSSTTLGADSSAMEVPGFAAAGRDAVFPGTQEQQALDNQLWGNNPYSSFGGEEPIRDATVVASIMEGRTGMFQASVGVNSNYGLVGNVSFTERNFDILKWPTAFWRSDGWADAFRGGGQIFRAEASPGKYYSRYSVSWDVPYIFNTNYNFGVTGLYADRYYDNWDDSRYGGELRFGRQWTPRFSTTINSGAYNIKIHNPRVNYVPDINEVLGNNSQFLLGLNGCYDTRNHPYLPSEGYVIDGSAEQIFGSYTYPRVALDGRTYHTIHRRVDGSGRMVLGLRSAAGWTGDDTPIYDRYFGGGYQNLRGFEYREVTPRYENSNIGIGGNFEFYNSAELLVPVSGGDEFQLAFFLDSGIVTKSINQWDTYRVAPGIGMRISIPMLGPAPLALDFAFPVVQNESDEKEIFSFSIQGSR